ncbi:hypothetical protein LCGC14_2772230, partial [marine sediment metagenome]
LLGGCSIALTVARCRDAGLNGWWCLVILVPILNSFVWIYFGCIRNDDHPKKLRAFEKLRVHNQAGFTLLELMATVVLVFIITIFATPWYGDFVHRARVTHAIGDIGEIQIKAQTFDLNNRRYPTNLAELGMDGLLDPWGAPYQFLSFDGIEGNGPKRKNRDMVPVNTQFDVYSMGPDGETASPFTSTLGRDDVVMAGDGTFFGEVGDFE